MKIKRTLVGIFSAFLAIIFGIGLFVPSRAKAAVYQNKQVINRQSCSDENFTYLLTTYSDYSAEIEVRAVRDINCSGSSGTVVSSPIFLTRLAYETNYQSGKYWTLIEQDNDEFLFYSVPPSSSYWTNAHVTTLTLEPTSTGTLYYDTSFIKIGDYIFNPIPLEDRTPQYTPVLDMNGDGVFNIEDPQFLLRFYLEACILNNYTTSTEGLNAFRTEYWRERNDVL